MVYLILCVEVIQSVIYQRKWLHNHHNGVLVHVIPCMDDIQLIN